MSLFLFYCIIEILFTIIYVVIVINTNKKKGFKRVIVNGIEMIITNRGTRKDNFKKFRDEAYSSYNRYRNIEKSDLKDLMDIHDIIINNNDNIFEVYFGFSLFDREEIVQQDLSSKTINRYEYGSRLQFILNDHAFVDIFLIPARTEHYMQTYEELLIKEGVDPVELIDDNLLKKMWDNFILCMKCTSMDGSITKWDKFRYWWLCFTNNKIVSNKIENTEFHVWIIKIVVWVLTVGCSGIALEIVKKIFE